ncbi:MAG: maleylacetoacetate isomerase [Myxococcales bacterium]|nr:maleylacetoacetate isomerase [Myxococcales bacterium]MCB9544340.1 maleylacetoacetate isomerase [Myxococcales bacterium]
MRLYTYWRSSCSWRVRISLHFKGLAFESVPVHLVRGGGQQHDAGYLGKNPMGQVPALETDEGLLTQSLAILEYLEERYPSPALLPADRVGRAHARAIAEAINSGVQPLQNLAVLQHLGQAYGAEAPPWAKHWITRGLARVEQMVGAGPFAVGEAPTFADACIVPQLYNARRFGCPVEAWPRLLAVEAACAALPAFQAAHPDQQPDAEP